VSAIHHVTAVTGDGAENAAFYTDVLGLRLVKRTVNHDAPDTWHLYYGGRTGAPGTALTFFVWPDLPRGRRGVGQATTVSFAVPDASLPYWGRRLRGRGVEVEEDETAGGRAALAFADPDGLGLRLVGVDAPEGELPGIDAPVPPDRAIGGFHGVTLTVAEAGPTAGVLEELLGYRPVDRGGATGGGRSAAAGDADEGAPGEGGGARLLVAPGEGPGRHVEVEARSGAPAARGGRGTVHHVAHRAADEDEQGRIREAMVERGMSPTPPVDRFYFRSVYAREPGGVLFEVATDGPGFTRDEDPERLGSGLVLPPWLEDRRGEIEDALPPLEG
jgi:glyoxalase family protein